MKTIAGAVITRLPHTVDGEVHVGHALVHHVGVRVLPGVPLPGAAHLTHEGLHQVHA
jgi:hypothetical protein